MAKTGLWRGLTALTGSVLTISLIGGSIADAKSSFLNSRLGTTNYIIEGGDESANSIYFTSEFDNVADLIAAKNELAEQISAEGSVLLKNDGALPLAAGTEKVTLWGFNSNSPILGGMMGSSAVGAQDGTQTTYGIREALAAKGFELNQDMIDFYSDASMDTYRMQSNLFGQVSFGHALSVAFDATFEPASTYFIGEAPANLYSDDLLKSADGTAAVVVISRDSSEAADYEPGMTCSSPEDSFERPLALSENERAVIALAKEHSTKVIVVLNADNALEIEELKQDDDIDAVLWAGAPGLNGFLGVADVLSGEVSPSGGLPDTYAVSSVSAPAMANYGLFLYTNEELDSSAMNHDKDYYGDWYVAENEGIYVGYKYYETRYEDQILGQGNADAAEGSSTGSAWNYADEVSYPFGYGLSYTSFEQKLDSVEFEVGGSGTAVVTVKNTGDVAGKCPVQLYVQAPYTQGGVEKAAIQLLDFAKTGVIEPGASETVTIEFDPQYMASYDENYEKEDGTMGAWVLDAGEYWFAVGNGAHEALNNVLAGKTGSDKDLVTITPDETISKDAAVSVKLDAADGETYSANVENALQDSDLGKLLGDGVEYTTRSDWSKGWNPVTDVTATEEMLVNLKGQSYALNENGDGVTWGAENGLSLIDFLETDEAGNYSGVVDINDEKWDQLMDQVTLEEAMTFIQAAGDDFENIDSIGLKRTYAQDGPVGIAYDQVAGYAMKWTDSQSDVPTYVAGSDEGATTSMASMPTEPVVAATFNKELVKREGELFGEDGLWANVQCQFAPGLNLHRTPYCGRNHEYYSEDSMLTNLMGAAVCEGGQSKGMMMEPKHFAFNHQELNRSGVSTFVTEQGGREGDLRAFQKSLSGNYAAGLMTAFNRVGTIYASGHSGILQQILRDEWGYNGWVISDMIGAANYQNWLVSVAGGTGGMLASSAATYANCTYGTMESRQAEILADTAFQNQMKQAIRYFVYQAAKSNAMNGITPGSRSVYVRTWWQNALLAVQIASAVLTALCAVLYLLSLRKKAK